MTFTLPTTTTEPSRVNPRQLLFYGPPKVGKTESVAALTLAPALGVDTVMLECEVGNADYVKCVKVPGDVPDLPTLLKWLESFKVAKLTGKRYRGVIDTIDKMEEWCEGDATAEYKKSLIGRNFAGKTVLDLPKGAGYMLLRTSFKSVLDLIEEAFYEVIYICHLRDKLLGEEGKQVVSKDLALTGRVRDIMCSRVNAIASLYRNKESQLIADFRTSELVVCGGHCPHLKGKQIVLGELDAAGNTRFYWDRIYLPPAPTITLGT